MPSAEQARAFLLSRGVPLDAVPPEQFAKASEETGMGFTMLLRFLGRLLNGGQGMGQAPIARGIAEDTILSRVR